MLDTEESDTFSSERKCLLGVFRSISIGPDAKTAVLVHYAHEFHEQRVLAGIHGLDLSTIYKALASVEREPVAFLIYLVATCKSNGLLFKIYLHGVTSDDAALAPSASHERSV
ncbi:unknown [Bacteroides sp. CAG:1060]|nr:unknown [Bacteroides sp. CAG:1060]